MRRSVGDAHLTLGGDRVWHRQLIVLPLDEGAQQIPMARAGVESVRQRLRGSERLALRENAEKVTRAAGLHVLPNRASWVPPQDPHRETIAALTVA